MRHVLSANEDIRVYIANGMPVVRFSSKPDVVEIRNSMSEEYDADSHGGSSTVILTGNQFLIFAQAFKDHFFNYETGGIGSNIEVSLGENFADLAETHKYLYELSKNPKLTISQGICMLETFTTHAGSNQEHVWASLYGKVALSEDAVKFLHHMMPQIVGHFKFLQSQSSVFSTAYSVLAETMNGLLKSSDIKPEEISFENDRFRKAYLEAFVEVNSGGYATNLIRKINLRLEQNDMKSELDMYSLVFQLLASQNELVKIMRVAAGVTG